MFRSPFRISAARAAEWTKKLRGAPRARTSPRVPLSIEQLEDREVPALIIVDFGGDSGPGSLRQAIIESNKVIPEEDEIRILQPMTGDILLRSALPTINGHVVINGDSTLIMPEPGYGPFRFFSMEPNGINVTLRRLAMFGGQALMGDPRGPNGGAIWALAQLTLELCEFETNRADGNGGAIYQANAPMTIRGTRLSDNSAGNSGGAVYSEGSGAGQALSIENSRFQMNRALNHGGAVYYDPLNGIFSAEGSEFSDNTAFFGNGGAIHITNAMIVYIVSDPKVKDDGIHSNSALEGTGGGLYSGCVQSMVYIDTRVEFNAASPLAPDTGGSHIFYSIGIDVLYISAQHVDPYKLELC